MLVLTAILLLLTLAGVILLIVLLKKAGQGDSGQLASRLDSFEKSQERLERAVREEVAHNREEIGKAAKEQRQEITESVKLLGDSVAKRLIEVGDMQKSQLEKFSNDLNTFAENSGKRLDAARNETASGSKQLREEVVKTLTSITDTMTATMKSMAVTQKEQLEAVTTSIAKLSESNEKKLEFVRSTVEGKLESIQKDNTRQLEQMRQTVDEKLQGTLEKRLGESFKMVGERLEQGHKGLGEMQALAIGVGDLKKVLTNVKTRGGWGEMQLGALLEQVLTPEQYSTNVATKGGTERVEYAIKLPGQGTDKDETVWLPIDSKFPLEDYQRLVESQDCADTEGMETALKQLETRVKGCAKEINEKHVNPPNTTNFGILFLPTEGLFAEVLRRPGLADVVQRDYRVVIAGPTTLWSILNSLQMGFRTLSIEKRSSEVWNLLSAVKTEWGKFGEALQKVQDKLDQASKSIDNAKTRSKAVGRKLRDVQELPQDSAADLLTADEDGEEDESVDSARKS